LSSPAYHDDYSMVPISQLCFTANQGQWAEEALFLARYGGADCWFTSNGVVYQFIREVGNQAELPPSEFEASHDAEADCQYEVLVIDAAFVGASPDVVMEGTNLLPYCSNYFIGNDPSRWRTDVASYGGVIYRGVYPGIDLEYHAGAVGLKYDFIVHPGADPYQISIRYEGVQTVALTATGDLRIETPWVSITEGLPVAYQEIGGRRITVPVEYELRGDRTFGFSVGRYDPALTLVIDPPVELVYSTYLGGSSGDWGRALALDASGCSYVTGTTASSDFPIQSPFQGSYGGGTRDAVIAKFSANGNELVYSTFLGGSNSDHGLGVDIDSAGCAHVTGYTDSSDFPTHLPFQNSNSGMDDAFVAKLSAGGNQLVYCTYLGGSEGDLGTGIAVDDAGCAHVTGYTWSTNFPLQNPFQSSYGGGEYDAFVTKFSSTGSSLLYSTFLGGSGPDESYGIALDPSGCAYVAGRTVSSDFPTQNPFQGTHAGTTDVFITKFTPEGSQLAYSTYLGGSGWDNGWCIAVDGDGCAFVAGMTVSADFPLQNPFQGSYAGGSNGDAFVTKLSAAGSQLVYSTFLGGSANEAVRGVAVDESGCCVTTGYTNSADFPTQNPLQESCAGDFDVFLTRFTPWGNTLYYSTYLGGSGGDYSRGIAIDPSGCAYVSGNTGSTDFPVLSPFQGNSAGGIDIFLAKFDAEGTTIEEPSETPVTAFALTGVFPNPFSTILRIDVSIPRSGLVEIGVFDTAGRRVEELCDQVLPSGGHSFLWDAGDCPSGVYFMRIRTGNGETASQTVLLLR